AGGAADRAGAGGGGGGAGAGEPGPGDRGPPGAAGAAGGAAGGRGAAAKAGPGPARNVTDPDSRLMPTRDGFIQGYNAQNGTGRARSASAGTWKKAPAARTPGRTGAARKRRRCEPG